MTQIRRMGGGLRVKPRRRNHGQDVINDLEMIGQRSAKVADRLETGEAERVAASLNIRPRRTLDWRAPATCSQP